MSTRRQAVRDYIEMRARLGSICERQNGDCRFRRFLEQQHIRRNWPLLGSATVARAAFDGPRRLGMSAYRPSSELPRSAEPDSPGRLATLSPEASSPISIQERHPRLLAAALEMPCRSTRCKLRPGTYYVVRIAESFPAYALGEARNLNFRTSISKPLCDGSVARSSKARLVRCTHQRAQCSRIISTPPTACAAQATFLICSLPR